MDDDERPPDQTVNPSDPEPRIADLDNPTDDELVALAQWHARNAEACFRRGVECFIDDDGLAIANGQKPTPRLDERLTS